MVCAGQISQQGEVGGTIPLGEVSEFNKQMASGMNVALLLFVLQLGQHRCCLDGSHLKVWNKMYVGIKDFTGCLNSVLLIYGDQRP